MIAVVKIGGELIDDRAAVAPVAADIAALAARGAQVAVVHGGGPQATHMQRRLGIEPRVVAGRRITDAATLDVMKMVVAGRLNVDLCAALGAAGARPVGLHGASSRAIAAVRRAPAVVAGGGPDPIDFGLVGDVVGFNRDLLDRLLTGGYVPVLACLGGAPDGGVLNINADIIANQLAAALGADHLVLVTGARGVLRDRDDPESRIPLLDADAARAAIADGTVRDGMIPKLDESIRGLASGRVGCVHVVGQLAPGELLAEIDAPGSVGTALVAGDAAQ
ncbi:MAG: acetylglutamate kinase [Deltaproteobacteria bacterium]|nr:MAG: acetylglutamate kinase [Deltaproteobacteria bacterium]